MTSNQGQVVGFVGLGAMGLGMACTLVKAGFRVKGYDINPASIQTFGAAGGEGVTSVAAAAEGVDALVIMVVNAEQALTPTPIGCRPPVVPHGCGGWSGPGR
jgi:L-threonate 2-dehydrogenase